MTDQNDLAQSISRAQRALEHWEERYSYYRDFWNREQDYIKKLRWSRILDDIHGKICKLKGCCNER